MAQNIYPKLYELMASGQFNWATDTIRAILVNDVLAYNRTHAFISDIVANELTGATRQDLASKTTADDGVDRWVLDAADTSFPSVNTGQTAGGVILAKFVTNDADSPLLCFSDAVPNQATTGADVPVQWSANGIIRLRYTT